ncbi:MAG TPA: hypothetical protein VI391_00885, partial [Thermoanaerobaculia bacterium]
IDEVDSDEVDSDKEPKGPGWAEAWDAESTARRKCFFCGTRDGDAAPLQLWANREREGEKELELLFVPRCRRCRRIHNVHGRFIAPLAIIAGLIGGFALYRVSGYTALIFATPVAAFFLGLLVTSPRTFGSRSRNDWRQIPELQRAMQDGWKLRARQEGVP